MSLADAAKHRSVSPKYVPHIIRDYRYWTLLVSDNQNYLGRMVVWLAREGSFQRFSQLTNEELLEMHQIIKEAESALHELWSPDHMNYGWLGNLFHQHQGHGHMHLIPRYRRSREYRGRKFEDGRWGQNYAPCENYQADAAMLAAMRSDIKKAMGA